MGAKTIQKLIDRVVGTEGILRIPSWWMHKILSDLVQYCDSLESSDAGIKEYLESQLNLVGDAIEALDARVSEVESHELFAIVSELPAEPKENTIYLVPSANGDGNNILTEWVYVNDAWEQFGEFKADVDLSGYVKKEDIAELQQNKEDKANKVTFLSDESTDNQYPSAKCVHDSLSSLAEEIASNGVLIEDLQNMKIDKENDDYYPKMAVGLADNLAGVDVVDSEINFRRSGGGAISDGVARIESIKGNSVVWNQQFAATPTDFAKQFFSPKGDNLTLEVISLPESIWAAFTNTKIRCVVGRKYAVLFKVLSGDYSETNTRAIINDYTIYPNTEVIVSFTKTAEATMSLRAQECLGMVFRLQVFDLTQMFGAGNEPATIEEFKRLFPRDDYAYNAGEVIHMDVQSIESVGVNQWDEEWEVGIFNTTTGADVSCTDQIRSKNQIKVLPNTDYYIKTPANAWILMYDKEGNVIEGYKGGNTQNGNAIGVYASVGKFKTAPNAFYMKFYLLNTYGATYNHDVCINLSDASINGKYFPHIKRVEDLSLIHKYFPDGMKSAGTAHDEIRYNKASGKWEKVVRIGEVDMGSLNWSYQGVSDNYPLGYFSTKIDDYKITGEGLCIEYVKAEGNWTIEGWRASTTTLYIKTDEYSDAASFKAAMQGVIFYYELAEPIVTELDAEDQYQDLDYQVWNAGTEKAIAEGKSAPLAADITYGFNAIGKIKELEEAIKALQTKVASL